MSGSQIASLGAAAFDRWSVSHRCGDGTAMCGIAALLWAAAEDAPPPADDAKAAVLELAGRCGIARRGPDSLDALFILISL